MRFLRFTGTVFFLLANIAGSAGSIEAQGVLDLSYVPIGHWSYQVFDRLAALGLIPLDAIAARPITRREARRLVAEASAHVRTIAPEVAHLAEGDLQRLSREFSTDSHLEIQARGSAGNGAPEFTPDRSVGISSAAAGLALSGDWLLFGRVVGGNSPGDPPAGEIYTSFQLGSVSFQLGRTSASWGPSLRTGLLLSDNAGTFPLFRLTAELPQARLTKVVASLERSGGSSAGDIVLIATRLDWMVTPRFRLGFNESLITAWGGPLTLYDLLEPIPVLSQVIAGYEFHQLMGQSRNATVAVDFDWLVHPGVRLYGVAFVDDAPERIRDRVARIGLLAGLFLVDPFEDGRTTLRFEYSAVTNGTYSYPPAPELEYAYRGRSLGAWFGPDGDDFYIEVGRHLDPSTDLQFSYAYTRHGQGRIGQPAPSPDEWVLSGIVEHRHTLGLQLQTVHSPSFETRYRAEAAYVVNQGNVAGTTGWEWLLGFDLTYRWLETPSAGIEPAESAPVQQIIPVPRRSSGTVEIRHWAPAMASSGPLSGPVESATLTGLRYWAGAGDFDASFAYEGGSEQVFWSVDLHYPLVRLQHGAVSVSGGWGGLTRHGMLGGTIQDITGGGPRLGVEFFYQFAPGGVGTPLYLAGELSSPVLRGPPGGSGAGGVPFYYWTYNVGVGWQFRGGWQLEGGYRGAVAMWQAGTPNQTTLYWDGLYASLTLK